MDAYFVIENLLILQIYFVFSYLLMKGYTSEAVKLKRVKRNLILFDNTKNWYRLQSMCCQLTMPINLFYEFGGHEPNKVDSEN